MNELLSILSGGLSGAIIVWLSREWISTRLKNSIKHEYDAKLETIKDEFKNQQRTSESKWHLKYEACMQALDLADAILSNMDFDGIPEGVMVKEDVKTEDVRDCINKLACSCDGKGVLDTFKKIIIGKGFRLDIVVDLRNAVREELEFSAVAIDTDRENSYIARVGSKSETRPESNV